MSRCPVPAKWARINHCYDFEFYIREPAEGTRVGYVCLAVRRWPTLRASDCVTVCARGRCSPGSPHRTAGSAAFALQHRWRAWRCRWPEFLGKWIGSPDIPCRRLTPLPQRPTSATPVSVSLCHQNNQCSVVSQYTVPRYRHKPYRSLRQHVSISHFSKVPSG